MNGDLYILEGLQNKPATIYDDDDL
jgi:hypothetical protein